MSAALLRRRGQGVSQMEQRVNHMGMGIVGEGGG